MPVPPAARLVCVALGVTGVLASGPARPSARAVPHASDGQPAPGATTSVTGAQDPAWSPDGRRLALSVHERVRVADADGRLGDPLASWESPVLVVERDPAWSPDGAAIVFAADRGEGFDLHIVSSAGGPPQRLTFLPGDERWPSWSRDGRVVFARHDGRQWDLAATDPDATSGRAPPRVQALTATPADEREPAVSPDGRFIAYVSTAGSEDGDADLWVMPMPARTSAAGVVDGRLASDRPARLVAARGAESRPAWSPDGRQVAFGATRDGLGSVWAVAVEAGGWPEGDRLRPVAPPALLSRHPGLVSWAPDGESLLVAHLPEPGPVFNGEARRRGPGPSPAFEGPTRVLRRLPAPTPPDAGSQPVSVSAATPGTAWAQAFDRTWSRLRDLYYADGPSGAEWRRLRDRHRPLALAAPDADTFERRVDEMIAAQPLVKAPVSSPGALVVSGHRLASEIGAGVLARGGNVADAAVAVSFALGVAEPDASGIGGDGMALVWLASMDAPVAVDFKDQTPGRASLDNAALFRDGRLVADGPAAANVPGLVAGMDLIHRRFGSRRLSWSDLVTPAADLAAAGIVVDEPLAATLAEGRHLLARYPASAELWLPQGRVPVAGERLANPDLADTLRGIAAGGAEAFYRGAIAQRIAEDMADSGGLISAEDLAGYRAVERGPLRATFRGHAVYGAPPPVASGAALLEGLQILDHYAPPTPGRYDRQADVLHYAIEAWKAREPVSRIADPALWLADAARHLSREHAAARFARIDPRRAGALPALQAGEEPVGDDQGELRIGRGTTAFVVADAAGNVVVVTQTLSTWGGSFYVSDGLGFLYNNHLGGYRAAAGGYGHLLPRMRSSSTALPTLVMDERDGRKRPRLALASAGNAWIPASVYGVLSAVFDGGLDAQAAIEAPRFLVTRDPADVTGRRARVQIEDRFPKAVLDDLASRGHVFQKIGGKGELRFGFAAAVLFDAAGGLVHAGTEPRRSHASVAVPGR